MKQKDFLIMLISFFILTVIWIAGNIYHNLAQSTLDEILSKQIIPIKSDFNTKAIEKTLNRTSIDPDDNIILPSINPQDEEISTSETIEDEATITPEISPQETQAEQITTTPSITQTSDEGLEN